jgi:hypothetical protein
MKKLVILSILLLVFHWVFAVELPKLNLEVGKTYTIETITHIDTSAQNPVRNWDQCKWLFTPISFNPSTQTYRMKAVLDYYQHVIHEKDNTLGWREKEVYETGYLQNYRSQMVFLNANKIHFYFDITQDGIVSSFDFSEYNQYKTPEGLPLKSYPDEEQFLGRDIQLIFFHHLDSEPSDKYAHRLYINLTPKKSNYEIVNEDSSSITLDLFPTIKDSSRLYLEIINERLTLDKKTGLILQRHLNYRYHRFDCTKRDKNQQCVLSINPATYYQKLIPDFKLNKKSLRTFQDGDWNNTTNSNANTLIKCKIANRIAGEDSVDILTGSNKDKCYRVPLSENNDFELGLTLNKSTLFLIRYPRLQWGDSYDQFRKNAEKSTFTFEAATGDNLKLNLNVTDSSLNFISVDGIYSTVFQLEKEFWFLNEHPLSNINFTCAKEKYLPFLNEYRLNADPRIYLNKLVDISYWEEMATIFNYMRRKSINSAQNSTKENRINPIENVIINNSLAKENPFYLQFLDEFLRYISLDRIQNLTGVQTFNSKTTVENRYYLAEALFAEPAKPNYLAFYIKDVLRNDNPEVAKGIFESFRRNYKESAVYTEVEKAYNRFIALTLGNIAPNFTLKDIYGKEHSLSNFKKKVVVLHFYCNPWYEKGINRDFTERFIPRLEETRNNTTDDLVYIFLLNGNNKKLIELIKSKAYKGIFLVAENGNYSSASKVNYDYNCPVSGTEFLINRNGQIVKKTDFWHGDLTDEETKEALAIPYQRTYNNIPIWIRIALISLVAALLAIALTFLFYRILTKRRLKKSELNKRMRELELTAIRAQMNPHFLYNCLNSIQNLVQKNQNEEAHLYLSKFAALIRQVLNTSKKEEVSLAEELETIHSYIDLEKLRFDFDYRLTIEEGIEPVSIFLPPMLLQPLVENALLHGLLPKQANRRLDITIGKKDNRICISVEDNGIGREASKDKTKSGNGKGLELTRERLTLMAGKYKTYYRMDIEDLTNPEGRPSGTRVTICFEEEK